MTWDYSCDATGKRRYSSSADATAALRATQRRGRRQRPYRCEHCHGWHLTSALHETRPKSRARTLYAPRIP